MNRRQFLQCAAIISANASLVPASWSLTGEQQTYLASQASYINQAGKFFTEQQRATVAAITDLIIPATQTPGALQAGVPRFIELMLQDWFNEKERAIFMAGLIRLLPPGDIAFVELTNAEQLQQLQQLEEQAQNSTWYEVGNVLRVWDESAPFICQIKELTVLGFFLSEVGATDVLRRNPMGAFKGDIALAKNQSAYAADLPFRGTIEE